MEWSSGFFANPSDVASHDSDALELVHSSAEGWFEIYHGISNGRHRAYKTLKPEYRNVPMCRDLLKKEYEIGAELDYPNIRRYIRFLETDEFGPAIEMEWIDGVTLDRYRLSGKVEAGRIICELCDALSYLHSKQITHCDLKPSNLIVTHNGSNLKLIDFGFSDSDNFALMKAAAGTLNYASPEQVEGGPVDCRSDIYSLGIIIREIMPWKKAVIRRCTRQDPKKRFQSAKDVKKAFLKSRIPVLATIVLATVALLTGFFLLQPSKKLPDEIPTCSSAQDTANLSIEDIFDEATKVILEVSGE